MCGHCELPDRPCGIEPLSLGPEGRRARTAEAPEGARRRSRGISPLIRGLARGLLKLST